MRGEMQKTAAQVAPRLFLGLAMLGLLPGVICAQQSAPRFIPQDENPEDFPAGPGRDDTFYSCTACHGFKLIAQQGMNRRQWEDSINLMVAKHNMPPLDAKTRETVLNYLEATFPPRTQRGWQNPFLNR
jgi:hypothetical protein